MYNIRLIGITILILASFQGWFGLICLVGIVILRPNLWRSFFAKYFSRISISSLNTVSVFRDFDIGLFFVFVFVFFFFVFFFFVFFFFVFFFFFLLLFFEEVCISVEFDLIIIVIGIDLVLAGVFGRLIRPLFICRLCYGSMC